MDQYFTALLSFSFIGFIKLNSLFHVSKRGQGQTVTLTRETPTRNRNQKTLFLVSSPVGAKGLVFASSLEKPLTFCTPMQTREMETVQETRDELNYNLPTAPMSIAAMIATDVTSSQLIMSENFGCFFWPISLLQASRNAFLSSERLMNGTKAKARIPRIAIKTIGMRILSIMPKL